MLIKITNKPRTYNKVLQLQPSRFFVNSWDRVLINVLIKRELTTTQSSPIWHFYSVRRLLLDVPANISQSIFMMMTKFGCYNPFFFLDRKQFVYHGHWMTTEIIAECIQRRRQTQRRGQCEDSMVFPICSSFRQQWPV